MKVWEIFQKIPLRLPGWGVDSFFLIQYNKSCYCACISGNGGRKNGLKIVGGENAECQSGA